MCRLLFFVSISLSVQILSFLMNSTGLNFSSVQYPGFEKRLQYIDDNKNQTIRIINKNSINRNALVEAEIPFSSFVSASNLCTIKEDD